MAIVTVGKKSLADIVGRLVHLPSRAAAIASDGVADQALAGAAPCRTGATGPAAKA